MPQRLLFPDARVATDALTFAGRARQLGDGAIRLQANAGTLAMTSAPLAPRGLLDATPTVLGMRVLRRLGADDGTEAGKRAAVAMRTPMLNRAIVTSAPPAPARDVGIVEYATAAP